MLYSSCLTWFPHKLNLGGATLRTPISGRARGPPAAQRQGPAYSPAPVFVLHLSQRWFCLPVRVPGPLAMNLHTEQIFVGETPLMKCIFFVTWKASRRQYTGCLRGFGLRHVPLGFACLSLFAPVMPLPFNFLEPAEKVKSRAFASVIQYKDHHLILTRLPRHPIGNHMHFLGHGYLHRFQPYVLGSENCTRRRSSSAYLPPHFLIGNIAFAWGGALYPQIIC